MHSAKDISDGGIAIMLAESAIRSGIGANADQDESLLIHPLFGLFAEPASTVIVTAKAADVEEIEKLAEEYSFLAAQIGTTGGDRLAITVNHEPFISASLAELREPWAESLEAALHNEVLA
jgi:phosphoribosylformylglycinamidine synthase